MGGRTKRSPAQTPLNECISVDGGFCAEISGGHMHRLLLVLRKESESRSVLTGPQSLVHL